MSNEKKSNKPRETETKAVTKSITQEELRNWLASTTYASCDPKLMLEKLGKNINELRAQKKPNKELIEQTGEEFRKTMKIMALDTHYLAAESVSEQYRPFLIQFARDVTDEYQCKTPSEKALAEIIATSYGRILELSSSFNCSQNIEFLSSEKNGYYGMIAKELDRAHRQFTTSLLVLKQIKSPTLEISINAKTAFIAQNQQVNATSSEPSVGNTRIVYENIDPK